MKRFTETKYWTMWTGSIIEWVELIYALYTVKRINNGEVSRKMSWQEKAIKHFG